jgi:phage gpG-like protein
VPKRTGRLAGSISVQRDQDGARLEMGGAGVPYAGWIEYGGSRGRPYVAGGRYVGRATEHADRDFARRTEQALAQIGRQL